MNHRPKSVTFICWFLIIVSVISLVSSLMVAGRPEVHAMMRLSVLPITMQYAMMILGVIVSIGSGVLMLKGKVLGRTIYVGWSAISFIISVVVSPDKAMIIPGLIVFLLFVFFLYRPRANAFFLPVCKDV